MIATISTEASITVIQDGVKSFASALLNGQEYEIFIDDRRIGVLNGYKSTNTCAVRSGPHSIYVRAYALAIERRSIVSMDTVGIRGKMNAIPDDSKRRSGMISNRIPG
jgi:hypothetical protein